MYVTLSTVPRTELITIPDKESSIDYCHDGDDAIRNESGSYSLTSIHNAQLGHSDINML